MSEKLVKVLGEELAAKVTELLKDKDVNLLVDNKEKPSFIPKDRFDEVIAQKNEFKTTNETLTAQLDELQKSAKGNDELTASIEALKQANLDLQSKHKKTKIDSEIKLKGINAKVKDVNDLLKFIDFDKITENEDGSLSGIDEQIKTLQETKSYFFGEAEDNLNGSTLNPQQQDHIANLSEKEKYNELLKKLRLNPNDSKLLQQVFLQKAKLK